MFVGFLQNVNEACFMFVLLQGLLAFYGLPLPHTLVQVSSGVPTSLPEGVLFEMQTLPVIAISP